MHYKTQITNKIATSKSLINLRLINPENRSNDIKNLNLYKKINQSKKNVKVMVNPYHRID